MGIPDYIARVLPSGDQSDRMVRLVCNGMPSTILGKHLPMQAVVKLHMYNDAILYISRLP